jgi:hypothetical protein
MKPCVDLHPWLNVPLEAVHEVIVALIAIAITMIVKIRFIFVVF